MTFNRTALTLAAGIALCVSAFAAPSPVGTWKGPHFSLTASATPQQRQQMGALMGTLSKLKVSLVFKKDHTFTSVEMASGAKQPKQDGGTWSASGDTISLSSPKAQGHSQKFTISHDGKEMSIAQGPMKITFTR